MSSEVPTLTQTGPGPSSAKRENPRLFSLVTRAVRSTLGPILRGTRFGALAAERIEGWMSRSEMNWLWREARRRHVIVEIGSWKGRSTHAIASATPGLLFFVEHFRGSQDGEHNAFQETESSHGIESVRQTLLTNLGEFVQRGSALLLDMNSIEAAKVLTPVLRYRPADMIFIDGDHSYEGAKSDIQTWRPLLKPGGLLCGHDSDWPGVKQALDELLPGWKQGAGSIWYMPSESIQ